MSNAIPPIKKENMQNKYPDWHNDFKEWMIFDSCHNTNNIIPSEQEILLFGSAILLLGMSKKTTRQMIVIFSIGIA